MGESRDALPVRFFVALLYTDQSLCDLVVAALCSRFGEIEFEYGPVAFEFSKYYADEMGGNQLKRYLCFARPGQRGDLPEMKTWSNALEQQYTRHGKRCINIDPGYVARDKLVLASTKDFYHRVYIGKGIFAEVTLHFSHGRFKFFSWTYPDYKEPGVLAMLTRSRAKLVHELRDVQPSGMG